MEQVILVDEQDNVIGVEEKLRAHTDGGLLHRAFSIFVFDRGDELLLQRRAAGKYHFAGLWSNTCCGHPRPGEDVAAAARRRLAEEFGFETDLEERFSFIYRAEDEKTGLTEHEFLHVFVGRFDGEPAPDPSEIDDWRRCRLDSIDSETSDAPDSFTPWCRLIMARAEFSEPA